MSDRDILFNRFPIYDVVSTMRRRIPEEILSEKRDYLFSVNEESYISHIVDKFTLNSPSLRRDAIEVVQQTDERTTIEEFGRPISITRNYVTFSVPFSGDRDLFFISAATRSSGLVRALVSETELSIKIWNQHDDGIKLREELDQKLNLIEQNLNWQKQDIDPWNANLKSFVEPLFRQRKEKLLKEIGAVQSLGFPLRKRSDMPTNYSVGLNKKKLALARPAAPSEPYKPQPVLDEAVYHDILDILRNMAVVMERSPAAFHDTGEEALRFHFLVQLNGQFEGNATGETFNSTGKTDILIRDGGRNLFVAECKFWKGAKNFTEALDQLLGYLTWRDAKVAAIIFVRDVAITTVLNQIPGLLSAHPCYLKERPQRHSGEFSALMKSKLDPAIHLALTVQVYNVPGPINAAG